MRKKPILVAVLCAAALLFAFGGALPAMADQPENAAPAWQNVGRKYTMEEPADLRWWKGDQAEVVPGENFISMSMMHCLDDGGFEYSFTEDAHWSLPPSSIPLGDEGSLVIDGTLEISKNQYSEYHYAYYYGGDAEVPKASLDIRMDIGYFYPDRDSDEGHELGKRVEAHGQTVFPGYVQLVHLRLEDPDVEGLFGDSVSLVAWEPETLEFSARVPDGDDSENWSRQAERIVQGDYVIPGTQLQAEGYVLTLTIEDSGAGYTSEYFYTFIPNAEGGNPSAAEGGSPGSSESGSGGGALDLSLVMFGFFIVCCALGFGIPELRKRRKARESDGHSAE